MGAATGSTDATDAERARRRPPLWAIELLDVLDRRGPLALWAAGVLAAIALVIAAAAPGVIAPSALVGLLVGVASLAAGVAVAAALDALDVRVRGPRHVRSAGGDLVGLLPVGVRDDDAADLATAVVEARPAGAAMHLGLAPVGAEPDAAAAWSRALAAALGRAGTTVLLADLTGGPTSGPGVLEVVRDRIPLADAVTYVDGAPVAELGAGADVAAALGAVVSLPTLLPDDVGVLLVALPQVSSRAVVNAARVLDQVLLVAEANLTSRVELMASLDALRVAGCAPQVVLVDGATYDRIHPGGDPPAPRPRPTSPLPSVDLDADRTVPARVSEPASVPATAPQPVAAPEPVTAAAPAPDPEPEHARVPAEVPEPPRSAGDPSAPLRTVDVLDAAARARAEAVLEVSRLETVPLDADDVRALAGPGRPAVPSPDEQPTTELPRPASPGAATPPVTPSAPGPTPAPSAPAPVPSGPAVAQPPREAALPEWASQEDEEDLLRTTVQLSAFEDELDLRDDRG